MTNETDEQSRNLRDKTRQGLSGKLHPLRTLFTQGASGDLELFDELIDNFEFELALHSLCDHLLEQWKSPIEVDVIERIAVIHSLMQIQDDCVDLLSAKARENSATGNPDLGDRVTRYLE